MIPAGSRLGPYEIVSPLGAGGMGEVYRARDTRLGREVAVKVLPASFTADSDRLRRFEQEAQAASALNHPNILAIYDIGTDGGAPYIVSELLEGETLRDRLSGGPLPPRKALAFKDRGPAWSPDGKRIPFYSDRSGRYEIWSIRPDGSGLAQLTRASTTSAWSPQWSPDASRIAFSNVSGTYFLALDKPLGTEKPQPLPPFDDAGDVFLATSWSDDGRALAGTLTRRDGAFIPGVVVYWIESKKYQRLTDFGSHAVFTGGSRRLIFGDPVRGKLLLLDASGRTIPLLDLAFENFSGLARVGANARDDANIFFVKGHTEADIWRLSWK